MIIAFAGALMERGSITEARATYLWAIATVPAASYRRALNDVVPVSVWSRPFLLSTARSPNGCSRRSARGAYQIRWGLPSASKARQWSWSKNGGNSTIRKFGTTYRSPSSPTWSRSTSGDSSVCSVISRGTGMRRYSSRRILERSSRRSRKIQPQSSGAGWL